jgi:hypothetical protein
VPQLRYPGVVLLASDGVEGGVVDGVDGAVGADDGGGVGHQSEAPFAQAAQRAQQRVAGPGIQVKLPAACWPLYRDMDAAACAFVPGVGQWPASPARATSTRPGGTAPTPRRPPRPAQLPPGQKTRPHRHPLPRPAHHQAGQPLQARHDQFRLSGIAPGPAAGRAEAITGTPRARVRSLIVSDGKPTQIAERLRPVDRKRAAAVSRHRRRHGRWRELKTVARRQAACSHSGR